MRVPAIVAGMALLLSACGGGKAKGTPDTTTTAAPAATPAGTTSTATPAGTGTTHVIQMVQKGPTSYAFEPSVLTIKVGDNVTFKGVSGLGHDVAFYADSIPPGAATVINAAIQDKPQDLATPMIQDGQSVTISFAGAPTGTYKFYCIPHQSMGMKGTLTVTQ
jgi:plastocyanin